MLMKTQYTTPAVGATSPRTIAGASLAHSKRPAFLRALDAADLCVGAALLEQPTNRQAAAMAKVSTTYLDLALAIAAKPLLRAAVEAGGLSLKEAAAHARPAALPKPSSLIEALAHASDVELAEAGHVIGVNKIWDRMIGPNV
jgi:hypothetical protein